MVSEIFKRTARDKELKTALAVRKEREEARATKIRLLKQDIAMKGHFPSINQSQSEKIDRDRDMNASSHGEMDGQDEEDELIRDMASRVLQARWRIMRYITSRSI